MGEEGAYISFVEVTWKASRVKTREARCKKMDFK